MSICPHIGSACHCQPQEGIWCPHGAQPPYPSDPMYCADCGQPYAADPMKRVRCHSGDVLLSEPPHPRDTWYPVRRFNFDGEIYWLYENPGVRLS